MSSTRIRFIAPFNIHVTGPDDLVPPDAISFGFKGFRVTFDLVPTILNAGEETEIDLSMLGLLGQKQWERMCFMAKHIEITIEERSGKLGQLQSEFLDDTGFRALREYLYELITHLIRYVRAHGIVVGIRRLGYEWVEEHSFLRRLSVQKYENEEWVALAPQTFFGFESRLDLGSGHLTRQQFERTAEALVHRIDPHVSTELIISALEHLKLKNYSYAVIESVISLEVVLTQFLKGWLSAEFGIGRVDIDEFLTPQFGLINRLSVLPKIAMIDKEFSVIEMNKVRQCVNWRNRIVHEVGILPDGIPPNTLIEAVWATINFSEQLLRLTRTREKQLALSPLRVNLLELADVADAVVLAGRDRLVLVKLTMKILKGKLDCDRVKVVLTVAVRVAEDYLKTVDELFRVEKHLRLNVWFRDKLVGSYLSGVQWVAEANDLKAIRESKSFLDALTEFRPNAEPKEQGN